MTRDNDNIYLVPGMEHLMNACWGTPRMELDVLLYSEKQLRYAWYLVHDVFKTSVTRRD